MHDSDQRLDHGVIGNGQVIALVAPTSAIEWLCLPRFDAPSLFGRLVDRDKGGAFRILAGGDSGGDDGDEIAGQMAYERNTNVLVTRFERGDAAWEVVDFAPRVPRGADLYAPPAIVRLLRPVRGTPRIRVDFDPRPDYGATAPELWERDGGIVASWPSGQVSLSTSLPSSYVLGRRPFLLDRPQHLTLRWGPAAAPETLWDVSHQLEATISAWRAWAKTCALPTFAPEIVLRSALCLKLHQYADTGAIIAAATTSIPEALNTPRTWDYRYCWLRDAAFVIEGWRRLSHLAEGERFLRYLRDIAESGELQPLYSVDGGRDLEERVLPHLRGFAGTGPVRIGNAAATQRQNDLCGELVLSIDALVRDPRVDPAAADAIYPLVRRLVDEAIRLAPTHDTGIWEFRSLFGPYTFSRVMCWAAMSRGANLAARLGHPDDALRWQAIADAERELILDRGFSAELGYFTQQLDGRHPDASLLLLPTIGIVDAHDPRFLSTLDHYERLLVDNGLMLRYRNEDDFGETTSAFTICSFWWAEALALAGRVDQAVAVFERVARHANAVGLFSEDVDPVTGALLGNFPQSYTHVGAIHAALTIGELLDSRHGRNRAWV